MQDWNYISEKKVDTFCVLASSAHLYDVFFCCSYEIENKLVIANNEFSMAQLTKTSGKYKCFQLSFYM